MKKTTLKILALTVLLAIAITTIASCEFIVGAPCTHVSVGLGDCQNRGKCRECGEPVGQLGDHVYNSSIASPTCTEAGRTDYTCMVCGQKKSETTTPALGHSFGEWIFTRQPTTDEAGEMQRKCNRCDYTESEAVPPHEHTLVNGDAKMVTCTTEGWPAYEYCTQCSYTTKEIIEPLGHAYGEYVSIGNGTHYRVCANNPAHKLTELCSGGSSSDGNLPKCEFCKGEYDFAVRPGNTSYGYHALGSYPSGKGMQSLYREMTATAEDFFTSDKDIAAEGAYHVIGEYDLTKHNLTLNEAMAVWKVFYVSNPAYYWLDASVVTRGDTTLVLTIADDYASGAYRRTCDAAIERIKNECAALVTDGMTDLEKAMIITEYIIKGMYYAYEDDGITPVDDMWAHSMAGFAMHGSGVCETYAKSFMYLCQLNGVECIIGSGMGRGEAHAWNYVKLDGEWYGADITWTDNSGEVAVYDYFGLSDASIHSDHISHSSTDFDSKFIYECPTLATKDIEPTALYKSGAYVGMYKSIDEAFAAMTDENAEYEINIGYFSFMVGAPVHSVASASTPNVKKLTVTGANQVLGENYLDNNSIIVLPESFALTSDVTFKNLHVKAAENKGSEIKLQGNTLTLVGNSVILESRVIGTENDSAVAILTVDKAYLVGGVNVYRLTSEDHKTVFGTDSSIKNANFTQYYTQNGAKVKIENKT